MRQLTHGVGLKIGGAAPPVVASVSRSGKVESRHRGSISVVDTDGCRLAAVGDADEPVYWRSAAKLHQALPLVMAGGMERWGLSNRHLAIICGSHNGEPAQVECV